MKQLLHFIKRSAKKVPIDQQNTKDVEGYYYSINEHTQIAVWDCASNRESKKHTHAFDEYMICLSGEYTAYVNQQQYILHPGDDLFIPRHSEQWGKCTEGTRTIHFFGGRRIQE
jgi:quercetin dioxygenase-like cupin family protein